MDLALDMYDLGTVLTGNLKYNTDLFDSQTIARIVRHFHTLLTGIVSNPDQSISDLALLTDAERHQLLISWNETWTDYPRDICLHQLFEAQVKRTPDAVAMVDGHGSPTYRELNRLANQLARHLHAVGVVSEMLMGIYMNRSLDMMVGLLGIMKAGAAYVPLDPIFPANRLSYMLKDAQIRLALPYLPW